MAWKMSLVCQMIIKWSMAIFLTWNCSETESRFVVQVVVWRNYEGAVQGVMQQVRMQFGELK